MVSLEWQKKYELGVQDIDLQHHYFVELINKLAGEFTRAADDEYCRLLIDELNAYARFHFISEENMMIRAQYPGLDEHRQHHQHLLAELSNMELELDMENSEDNVNKMLEFLITWFLSHTAIEDRQFTTFLQQQ